MANETAHPGPYTDLALTRRNVTNPDAEVQGPAFSGPTTLGAVKHYNDGYVAVEPTIENPDAEVMPHAPVAWTPDRDLYANNGGVGQDFLQNAGAE